MLGLAVVERYLVAADILAYSTIGIFANWEIPERNFAKIRFSESLIFSLIFGTITPHQSTGWSIGRYSFVKAGRKKEEKMCWFVSC